VRVAGIRATGRHGANPRERDDEQEFVVDVEVWVEPQGDSLGGTLDYRTIAEAARRVVESGSFVLLETLAGAVAAEVARLEHASRVRAVVHKPGAARHMDVVDVAAEVTLGTE
jgi:dihydroneopterin aldolase